MKPLANAIVARFRQATGESGLHTLLSGRLYFMKAPQGAVMPYAVFFPVSSAPERNLDGTMEAVVIQFSIFDKSDGIDAVSAIADALRQCFDDAELEMENFYQVKLARTGERMLKESDAWHYSIDYQIIYQEA